MRTSKPVKARSNEDVARLTAAHVASTYNRFPVALVRGKGMKVWDKSGNVYLDFVAGLAVDSLGHCHPKVVQAIRRQAGLLLHVSNLYHIEPQSELAAELTRLSFAGKYFFCNSGTEANEAAIKLARRFFHDRGEPHRHEIITLHNSFHGRTMGALSATAQEKFHAGFAPLLPGFKHVPFNDFGALERALSPQTCAIMIEPVQGEGGVNIPDRAYLKKVRTLCHERGLLLIFDEVQTGLGRLGALFGYERFGVKPDIITLAKALGGGMAIGAMGATDAVIKSFVPGTHAATFGGNPLACAAALAALRVSAQPEFLKRCRETGDYFLSRLKALQREFPRLITDARGMGLMLAISLTQPGAPIVNNCMRAGYLINCTQQNVLRFVPPLTVARREIDGLIKILAKNLRQLEASAVTA